MSILTISQPVPLRTYPARWKGPVILACAKCQKKLKHSNQGPGKLKKVFKRLARNHADPNPPHVVPVSCLKLCPKGGVTVCSQAGLLQSPPLLTILYTDADAATLYKTALPDDHKPNSINTLARSTVDSMDLRM